MTKTLRLLFPKLSFFSFLFLIGIVSKAQDIPVTIKVINNKKEPLASATISVINRLDSNQLFKKAADSNGRVVFQLKKNGQYTVNISSINYQPIEKGIIVSSGQ